MAIEAPLSRYRRNNLLIYIAVCLVLALWFSYDGYINRKFIAEHTTKEGRPDGALILNQKAPPVLILGALAVGAYWYAIRNRKLVAAEDALIIADKKRIPYDAIEKIDKTHFETKGLFTITYKHENGRLVDYKLSDRQYGNLGPILDHLIAQIS
jgi:hypothetical protein